MLCYQCCEEIRGPVQHREDAPGLAFCLSCETSRMHAAAQEQVTPVASVVRQGKREEAARRRLLRLQALYRA